MRHKFVKKFFCVIFIVLALGCAFAQTIIPPHQWSVTLKVVDEGGTPVFGAHASVGYFANSQPASFDGLTDSNGIFSASYSAKSDLDELGFEANKSGFYTTRIGRMLFPPYDPVKWDIVQTLIIKKIGKPIPMYAKWVRSEPVVFKKTGRPPIAFNRTVGYDLMIGDWVAPYGNGINTDLSFTEEFHKQSANDFDYKLTVNFPKPGDGIQEFIVPEAEKESDLRSPHTAPADGYQAQLIHENIRHAGQPGKSDYDPNRNYFFRVRTVLDNQGNIVSAYYGKIYGDFMQFSYYLNPTPNDRNIEFAPRQSLIGGLKSFEQVIAP